MARLSGLASLVQLLGWFAAVDAVTVTVNVGQTYQQMDGFGFSQAFGRANDVKNLPSTQQKQTLDLLFSTSTGAGMTILRNRIGSGGSGDSIEPTSPGSPSATPKYVWDSNDSGQLWFSQQAKTYGVSTFYADAWSAPGFMKTNNNQNNGGYLCGVTGESCSSGNWLQAYANFLVQYVKYYAQSGIAVTHLGFLNEPDYTTSYSSMNSNGQQAADFIKVLYSTVHSAGLATVPQLTCCDATGWNAQSTLTAGLISAGVENDLGVITSHTYSSSPGSPQKTTRKVWETETADLDGSFNPNNWYSSGIAGEGFTWANNIYTAIVTGNVSAYLYWEGAEVGTTNSALITISGTTPTASKRLWAFAQWSRSVRPGAVRVGTSGSGTGLKFSAFKNPDGTVSVQVLNSGTSAQSITVAPSGFTVASAKGFVSAQGTDLGTLSVTVSGGQATASSPAHSMITFILSGSASTGGGGTSTTSTSSAPTSTGGGGGSGCTTAIYGQCGGSGFTGCTTCASGSTCKYSNDFYSQCL